MTWSFVLVPGTITDLFSHRITTRAARYRRRNGETSKMAGESAEKSAAEFGVLEGLVLLFGVSLESSLQQHPRKYSLQQPLISAAPFPVTFLRFPYSSIP